MFWRLWKRRGRVGRRNDAEELAKVERFGKSKWDCQSLKGNRQSKPDLCVIIWHARLQWRVLLNTFLLETLSLCRCSSTWLTPVKFRLIACAQEGVLCAISSLVLCWQITALQVLKRKFVDIFQEVMEIKMFSFDIFLTTVDVRISEPLPSFSPSRTGRFSAGCAAQAGGHQYYWSCRWWWSTSPHRLITLSDLAFNRPEIHYASQPIEHLCKYSKNFSWSLNLSFSHHFGAPPSISTSAPSYILQASVHHCFVLHIIQVASFWCLSLVIEVVTMCVWSPETTPTLLRAESHAPVRLADNLNWPLIICSWLLHTWL